MQHTSPKSFNTCTIQQQQQQSSNFENVSNFTNQNLEDYGHNEESRSNNNDNNNDINDNNNDKNNNDGNNVNGDEMIVIEETRSNDSNNINTNNSVSTTTENEEITIVNSPELFAFNRINHQTNATTTMTTTTITTTTESIDCCSDISNEQENVNSNSMSSTDKVTTNTTTNTNSSNKGNYNDSDDINNNNNDGNGNKNCTSTSHNSSDNRPPKKRFMQIGSDVARIRPIHSQPSAFVEPIKLTKFPLTSEQFEHAMNQWEWINFDGFKMPVIFRATERYAAVHIVQLKLLSKFPPHIPTEMANKFMMISHKMLPIEAWIFNSINAVICKFDLGCQLFTTNDEIVRLQDVERFYWSVKALNLNRMIEFYNSELRNVTSTHLMAAITQVRNHVESDLQEVEKELIHAQINATANTVLSSGSVR